MTKNEALLLSAYTGYMLVDNFADIHEFIEKTLERPVYTHELADDEIIKQIQDKLKPKLLEIIKNIKD